MTTRENVAKLFAISGHMLLSDLDQIEVQYDLNLGHKIRDAAQDTDETYYPQFEESIRREAAQMARHYEIFYCLEKTIRRLISEALEAEHGEGWWDSGCIPENIHQTVADRVRKEIDSGVTRRSLDNIDYTTFGELAEVIRGNWEVFGAIFMSPKAVTKIMTALNTVRGPIAHCSPLAEDEMLRLKLAVRDWFRQMD